MEVAVAARAFGYECPVLGSAVIGGTNPDEIRTAIGKRAFHLLASDFDQTLSFNDSGYALWDRLMFCEMSIFERLRK